MATYKASVDITLRKSILDVQGKTVEHALHSLDFTAINNVRMGKFVELEVQADSEEQARSIINDACQKLIANPVMEDYTIHLSGAE